MSEPDPYPTFPVVKTAAEAIEYLRRGCSVALDASGNPDEMRKLGAYHDEEVARRRRRSGVYVVHSRHVGFIEVPRHVSPETARAIRTSFDALAETVEKAWRTPVPCDTRPTIWWEKERSGSKPRLIVDCSPISENPAGEKWETQYDCDPPPAERRGFTPPSAPANPTELKWSDDEFVTQFQKKWGLGSLDRARGFSIEMTDSETKITEEALVDAAQKSLANTGEPEIVLNADDVAESFAEPMPKAVSWTVCICVGGRSRFCKAH